MHGQLDFQAVFSDMSEVSQLLERFDSGDPIAAEELLPLVYDDLRKVAAAQLASERPGLTLQPTALVHEAFLRLVGPSGTAAYANRRYFFAAAAEAMRRILVERARRLKRLKHGGNLKRVDIAEPEASAEDENLIALDEALIRLAAEDPIAAKVVELHHFAGLGHEQVAETLDITVYRARQKWTFARAWLREAMEK
jgi:RNA polymerase sigma factor (TIGR02999 family)